MSEPARLSLVVAAAENSVIGRGNALPWRLPDDLRRFKALTLGKPVVMGHRTYQSIGRPLPERSNIVVSRQPALAIAGCIVVPSIEAALAAAQPAAEIMIIGGAQLYEQTLPRASTIHLTRVHARLDGDVRLPALAAQEWREVASEYHPADERHAYAFTYLHLERMSR